MELSALFQAFGEMEDFNDKPAALVLAWYSQTIDDSRLAVLARETAKRLREQGFGKMHAVEVSNAILAQLGETLDVENDEADKSSKAKHEIRR